MFSTPGDLNCSVGTLADGFVKKVYDKNTTSQYPQSHVQIIKNIKEQLNKLQQSGALQGEDVTFMARWSILTTSWRRKRTPSKAI